MVAKSTEASSHCGFSASHKTAGYEGEVHSAQEDPANRPFKKGNGFQIEQDWLICKYFEGVTAVSSTP